MGLIGGGVVSPAEATTYVEGKGQNSVFDGTEAQDSKLRALGGYSNYSDEAAAITSAHITIKSGDWNMVVGGHYLGGSAELRPAIKDTYVEIDGGTVYQLIGGSGGSGDRSLNIEHNNQGTTKVIINQGLFGADKPKTNVPEQWVLAGDLMKFGNSGTSNAHAVSNLASTSLVINDGTFNAAVVGGSAAVVYYDNSDTGAHATVDTTNVTINGGTFNHGVSAGGFGVGHSSVSTVNTANLTINKTEDSTLVFNNSIFAGGFADTTFTTAYGQSVVNTSNITVNRADVGDIYGTVGYVNIQSDHIDYTPTTDKYQNPSFVKTQLTLNNATAKTVWLGLDSDLKISGGSKINELKLDGSGIKIIGTGTDSSLTITKSDFNAVTFDGTLTFNGPLNGTATILGSISTTPTGSGTYIVNDSGTLIVPDLAQWNGTVSLNGGTLQAPSSVVFVTDNQFFADTIDQITIGKDTQINQKITGNDGSLALTDQGVYSEDSLAAMSKTAMDRGLTLSILNAKLAGADKTLLTKNVIQATQTAIAPVSKNEATQTGTLKVDSGTAGAASIQVSSDVKSVELVAKNTDGSTGNNLLVAGTIANNALFTDSTDTPVNVSVGSNVTLQLGHEDLAEETQGSIPVLEVAGKGKVVLSNIKAELQELSLKTGSEMAIGTTGKRGEAQIKNLSMEEGSKIFLDPVWIPGSSAASGSWLIVTDADTSSLGGQIAAGHNSAITMGANKESALHAIEDKLSLSWGKDVTSAFYIGTPFSLPSTGSINIDGSLEGTAVYADAGKINIATDGLLAVDQQTVGTQKVISGATVVFNKNSFLGIVNAAEGTFSLADAVENPENAKVITDNPFIAGALAADGTVSVTQNAEGGLGALASTGIQAMTRRADTVLAQTIADRTSVDQELAAGTNLWVDVTGERYEADKLDNGGEFKSDMGYGAFGADFAVTQDITAGAAFQYGKGTLRSCVSSIKNSIDSYGVTAYGAMKFGDAKVVAEASYIKNENDITSSQTALNQSIDSEIYSVGMRGQHRFTAGNFQFVPSVGVRVSRLNTDAMQVGAVNIKKQEQTLVQVPIALRVNGFEQNVNGWSVAPSFKVAYVPTFGDKEITVLGADQTVIDTNPVQGDFGIRAQNGNLMVNANMMLGCGKDGTSSVGGKIGLKYVF